jgi:hypothetical protein
MLDPKTEALFRQQSLEGMARHHGWSATWNGAEGTSTVTLRKGDQCIEGLTTAEAYRQILAAQR